MADASTLLCAKTKLAQFSSPDLLKTEANYSQSNNKKNTELHNFLVF